MFSGLFPKNGFNVELSKLRFFFVLVAFSDSRVVTGFVDFKIHLICGQSNLHNIQVVSYEADQICQPTPLRLYLQAGIHHVE